MKVTHPEVSPLDINDAAEDSRKLSLLTLFRLYQLGAQPNQKGVSFAILLGASDQITTHAKGFGGSPPPLLVDVVSRQELIQGTVVYGATEGQIERLASRYNIPAWCFLPRLGASLVLRFDRDGIRGRVSYAFPEALDGEVFFEPEIFHKAIRLALSDPKAVFEYVPTSYSESLVLKPYTKIKKARS